MYVGGRIGDVGVMRCTSLDGGCTRGVGSDVVLFKTIATLYVDNRAADVPSTYSFAEGAKFVRHARSKSHDYMVGFTIVVCTHIRVTL